MKCLPLRCCLYFTLCFVTQALGPLRSAQKQLAAYRFTMPTRKYGFVFSSGSMTNSSLVLLAS